MASARARPILDVDTGTDDAVALMLAGLHPALDLVAATAEDCGSTEIRGRYGPRRFPSNRKLPRSRREPADPWG
jgi:hypothetical protein